MATSVTRDATFEDWAETHEMPGSDRRSIRAELLWTLFGLALLVAFLFFVIDDYPLRSVLAAH